MVTYRLEIPPVCLPNRTGFSCLVSGYISALHPVVCYISALHPVVCYISALHPVVCYISAPHPVVCYISERLPDVCLVVTYRHGFLLFV
jgi:hypothetical protein